MWCEGSLIAPNLKRELMGWMTYEDCVDVGEAMSLYPALFFERWESVRNMLVREEEETTTIGPFIFAVLAPSN